MHGQISCLGLVGLAVIACSRSRPADVSGEAARISALYRQSVQDLAARRFDAFTALFASDARLMRANAPVVEGRDAIVVQLRDMAGALPRFRSEVRSDSIVVAGTGDYAFVQGRYRFTPDTAHPGVFDIGRYLGVLKREGRDWRIAVDMTVSDGAAGTAAPGDEVAVRDVVESYLHGLKFNDVESLKRAFWPDAKLYFVDRNGRLGLLTQGQWYEGFAGSAGREEDGELRIASINVTRDIANVTVVEEYPRSRYTDYLSLVKFDSGWRIVNKVYTAEPR